MAHTDAAEAIIARERRALDHWSAGHPLGYIEGFADDATYFDDVAAHRRIDGRAAISRYVESSLEGKIPPHRYALVDPKVQLYGHLGVLTLRYEPSAADGTALPPWRATTVYQHADGDWRVVHAHWSLVKEP